MSMKILEIVNILIRIIKKISFYEILSFSLDSHCEGFKQSDKIIEYLSDNKKKIFK